MELAEDEKAIYNLGMKFCQLVDEVANRIAIALQPIAEQILLLAIYRDIFESWWTEG